MSCYFKKTIGFAILISLSIVFPAIFVQAAAPLTLKASAAEAPKTQAQPQKTVQSGGTSGGKQMDPFRKSETTKKVEKRPNMFQDLLDRQVELPTKKRPPAPLKKKADITNPFEEAEESGNPFGETRNPFEDAEETDNPLGSNPFEDNPFGDNGSGQFGAADFDPSNPFAAGDPFADEARQNQAAPQASGRSNPGSTLKQTTGVDIGVREIPGQKMPVVVKMEPANGATNVDAPAVKELRVTFDTDMDTNGHSWCGGGEMFPKIPANSTPKWIDKRTCTLPVELENGKDYLLGINAPSFKNFRSAAGVPVTPLPYKFSTKP